MSAHKATLAKTAADHDIGTESVVPEVLKMNPGKTLAETMDDVALVRFIQEEVDVAQRALSNVRGGKENAKTLQVTRDQHLLPNIKYLASIGRLPAQFASINFEHEFAL